MEISGWPGLSLRSPGLAPRRGFEDSASATPRRPIARMTPGQPGSGEGGRESLVSPLGLTVGAGLPGLLDGGLPQPAANARSNPLANRNLSKRCSIGILCREFIAL